MNKTIITSIVSVICTAAICITAFLCVGKALKPQPDADAAAIAKSESEAPAYMTEAQAAAYLGIEESRLTILRKNLKYLEGSYIVYTYANDSGEEESVCIYSKAQLDKAIVKLMSDSKTSSFNFKYLEEALKEAEK